MAPRPPHPIERLESSPGRALWFCPYYYRIRVCMHAPLAGPAGPRAPLSPGQPLPPPNMVSSAQVLGLKPKLLRRLPAAKLCAPRARGRVGSAAAAAWLPSQAATMWHTCVALADTLVLWCAVLCGRGATNYASNTKAKSSSSVTSSSAASYVQVSASTPSPPVPCTMRTIYHGAGRKSGAGARAGAGARGHLVLAGLGLQVFRVCAGGDCPQQRYGMYAELTSCYNPCIRVDIIILYIQSRGLYCPRAGLDWRA